MTVKSQRPFQWTAPCEERPLRVSYVESELPIVSNGCWETYWENTGAIFPNMVSLGSFGRYCGLCLHDCGWSVLICRQKLMSTAPHQQGGFWTVLKPETHRPSSQDAMYDCDTGCKYLLMTWRSSRGTYILSLNKEILC